MDFLTNLLSDEIIYAIGWAVIHSLWQATLIAFLMSFAMSKKGLSSSKRYLISCSALVAVLFSGIVTFYIYYSPSSAKETIYSMANGSGTLEASTILPNLFPSFIDSMETYFPLIVSVWIIGSILVLIKLFGGMVFVNNLHKSGIPIIDRSIIDRLEKLKAKIDYTGPIRIIESARVQTPMLIGHLKPVVLFPIGLINFLDLDEVEAVLAHELSHIARNDYLVNLIQSFIEVLFYYHPAVWWISANIKSERENCCDDMAISLSHNKYTYANALVKIKEMEINYIPNLAIAFAEKNNQLFDRIKRIFNQAQNKSYLQEKLAMLSMLAVCLCFFSFSNGLMNTEKMEDVPDLLEVIAVEEIEINEKRRPFVINMMNVDTVPIRTKNKITISGMNNDKHAVIELKEGQVISLKIDGKDIPQADYEIHAKLIEEMSSFDEKDAEEIRRMADVERARAIEMRDAEKRAFELYKLAELGERPIVRGYRNALRFDTIPLKAQKEMLELQKQLEKARVKTLRAFGDGNDIKIIIKDGDDTETIEWSGKGELPAEIKAKLEEKGISILSEGNFGIIHPAEPFGQNEFFFKMDSLRTFEYKVPKNHYQHIYGKNQQKLMERLEDQLADVYIFADSMRTFDFEFPHFEQGDNNIFFHRNKLDRQKELGSVILNELKRDGLISDPNKVHEFELSGKKMKVNGKKMPKEIWRKYKKLYEDTLNEELTKSSKYVHKGKIKNNSFYWRNI